MNLQYRIVYHHKLFPLAISRGVNTGGENLYVMAMRGGHVGYGEMAPATARPDQTAQEGLRQIETFSQTLDLDRTAIHDAYAAMHRADLDPAAMAALDVALWDLQAQEAGMPLSRLLGLPRRSVPTSVTIGIETPEIIRERVPDILSRFGATCLKIKLGSPKGIEHDQENFLAAKESSAPFGAALRVDANGGWSLADAKRMLAWLATQGVDYVEQPLVEGAEDALPELFATRQLPIFVDESCRFARDVPGLADRVDGVNLKLMKCGGITEALRIVACARACGLKTMIGCMSEGSVAIAAGASIASLFDYVDLDSHLNLNPDPAEGTLLEGGVVLPEDRPGHGGRLKE